LTNADALRLGRAALSLAAAGAVLAACSDWAGYDIDMAAGKVPQLATMRRSVIPDPYGMPRLPAPGSIPVASPNGETPPPFNSTQLDSVAPTLHNPYAGGAPAAVMARGEVEFQRNCFVCHGPEGAGNGPIVGPGKFPFAPAINSAATAARADGYIYGVISVGRGLMPPYGFKLADQDRWAVVEYVRSLQQRAGNTPQRGGSPAAQAPQPANTAPPPAATVAPPAVQAPPAQAPAAAPARP
jgi:mono/diheme cytochrome c family protein